VKITCGFICVAATLAVSPGAAQSRFVVEGRVLEARTGTPIPNAAVDLDGRPVMLTSAEGTFRFEQIEPGGYALRVVALGYAPSDLFLVIRRDTTLVIELEIDPLRLDTVAVEGRRVDMRGRVKEKGSDLDLFRAEVLYLNRRTETGVAGGFRLRDVPAGVPLPIAIRAFGYLPLQSTIVPVEDTTFVFELEPDALVQRMITVEVDRLKERSGPFLTSIMRPIDRAELLRRRNWTVLDVIKSEYSQFVSRVRCILIDDVQNYNGLDALALYLPDELERIEVLERGAMLRIYTREYIKRMLGGGIRLQKPLYVGFTNPPLCR
jgi:hypothetical protein